MSLTIRTLEEKQVLIKQFKASGKSMSSWCHEQGIPSSTFSKWLKLHQTQPEQIKFISIQDSKQKTTPVRAETEEILSLEIGPYKLHIKESISKHFLSTITGGNSGCYSLITDNIKFT